MKNQSDMKHCYLIGNGPGLLPHLHDSEPFIRFNLASAVTLSGLEIRICNRRIAGRPDSVIPFLVSSRAFAPDWCEHLQTRLAASAAALTDELGCLPSAGLATIHALLGTGAKLQLYRMPLRPSLLRTADHLPRMPLAAAFHNWLGERRLAWHWWQARQPTLQWPDLILPPVEAEAVSPAGCNPYPALLNWFVRSAGTPREDTAASLHQFATVPGSAWCRHATQAQLQALEGYFFLQRDNRVAANWWLYSNDLSPLIDTLLLRLMQAQQQLFTRQVAS